MDSTSIVKFCKNKDIKYFDIKVRKFWNDKQNKMDKELLPYNDNTNNYNPRPSQSDFFDDNIYSKRPRGTDMEYIAIDTSKFIHLDIDHLEDKDYCDESKNVIEHFKNQFPYFKSLTKKLGYHFMFTTKFKFPSKRTKTRFEDIEFLAGQWAWVKKDTQVFNYNEENININDYEMPGFFPEITEGKKNNNNINNNKNKKELIEIVQNIDSKYADEYDSWTKIIWALKNDSDDNKKIAIKFSKSGKYKDTFDEDKFDKLWENTKTGNTIGTVYMYSKMSNPNNYNKIKMKYIFHEWIDDPDDPIVEKEKEIEKDIEKELYSEDDKSYEAVKYRLEKEHFLIESPMILIKEFVNFKKQNVLNMLDGTSFRTLIAPYKYEYETYSSKGVEIKTKSIYTKWIEDENRRSYKQLIFYPKLDFDCNNSYNLFNGYNYKRQPDYIKNQDGLDRFLKLVDCLCGNDKSCFEYLLNWTAHLLQRPEELPRCCILIKSQEGCGKDTFREYLQKILGNKYVYTTDKIDNILGQFNPNVSNKLLIQLNEAKSYDGHSNVASLKHFICTNDVDINQKNVKTYSIDNYARLLIFSNECNVVKITAENRRYIIIKSGNKLEQDFYTQLYDDLKQSDIIQTIFEFLMSRPIDNFKLTDVPINKAYNDMVESNTNPIYEFIYNKTIESETDTIKITQVKLFFEYEDFLVSNGIKIEVNRKSIKSLLCDVGLQIKVFKINGKTCRGFVFNKTDILNNLKSKYTPSEIVEIDDSEETDIDDELD